MGVDLKVASSRPAIVEVALTGKLEREDYEEFAPAIDALIREHGKIRLLVRLVDFQGWSAGALWEDLKVDLKHFNDIERLAFVGEETWEKGMAAFCKPFTTAEIRFFTPVEIDDARAWLNQDVTESA
jgi:hypothetical protein